MKIENKTIVVTGGSSGLGIALARELSAMGNNIVLIARDQIKLQKAKEEIGGPVLTLSADVSKSETLEQAMNAAAAEFGQIDILINSAGILIEGEFENLSDKDFRNIIDVNLHGTIASVRAALPWLKKSKGSIVNIASVAGLLGVYGYTAYCSSKHALLGFTKALRYDLKASGITVQAVCPPEFDTPMVERLDEYRSVGNLAHSRMIPKMELQDIVHDTIKGMQRGTHIIIPGTFPKLIDFSSKLFPGVAGFFSEKTIEWAQR